MATVSTITVPLQYYLVCCLWSTRGLIIIINNTIQSVSGAIKALRVFTY